MGAPQIIVIALFACQLLLAADKHGQPKPDDKYNLAVAVIRIGIWASLLWWGGFFGGAS